LIFSCRLTDPGIADAHKLSAEVKHDLPGRGKEFEKKGEALTSQAGREIDRAVRISSPY
jgi:hypothetical protein